MMIIRINKNVFSKERILSLFIPLIVLVQIRSSFTWTTSFWITSGLVLLVSSIVFSKKKITLPNELAVVALFLSIIVFVFLNIQASSIITLLAFVLSFHINERIKEQALNYLTSFLAVIISVSLPLWLIHINNIIEIPLYRLLDLSFIGNEGFLEDYLFFVNNPMLILPRYYSIFEEPGALGTLIAFVIAANQYCFRDKRVIVLLIGLIFTYSLAGYLVFIVGLLLYKIKNIKTLFLVIILGVLFLYLLYYLCYDIEVVRVLIFDRITDFDERGLEHRNSDDLNTFFSSYILSVSAILGMGEGYAGDNFSGASYKFFLIDYGWLGIVALIMLYMSIYISYKKRKYVFPFIYALVFLPQYNSFLSWQILLFSISCSMYSNSRTHIV